MAKPGSEHQWGLPWGRPGLEERFLLGLIAAWAPLPDRLEHPMRRMSVILLPLDVILLFILLLLDVIIILLMKNLGSTETK